MKIGLIGYERSGKSTIFNALSGQQVPVDDYKSDASEPNIAVVSVIDDRLQRLSEIYKPKKNTAANFELVDFIGFTKDSEKLTSARKKNLEAIRYMDALAIVIRNFSNDVFGLPTPEAELDDIEVELLIPDIDLAEKRLEKLAYAKKRGQETPHNKLEEKLFEKILGHLQENLPLRTMMLSEDEKSLIIGYNFLTLKSILLILNSDEDNFSKNEAMIAIMEKKYPIIEFCGKFEMELASLDEDEAKLFMEDLKITESAQERLTKGAYKILGLISFFTVGADEVKAWTIHKGDTALAAAGKIHTDLARGFIRAQCCSYSNLIKWGSEKKLKEKGLSSLEGKNYIVKDGDILNIMFNI